jgi:TRAP transporter TAXI family solute receptor
MRRRTFLVGGAGIALLSACESGGAEATGTLRIATGSSGAVYYKYGTAIAELAKRYLPKVHATVVPSNASADNVHFVLTGKAEVGFTQADIASAGNETAPGQLAALARLYDDYVHVVAAARGPISTVDDLAGRRVSVGAPGSGTAVTADRFLSVVGASVDERQLGLDDSVAALRTGQIDAFFFSGGLPVASIAKLAEEFPIRLINLQASVQKLRDRYGDHYAERVVPASTYAGITATVTIGIANYLVVRVSMPEPLAYGVTRLLFEGRDELAKAHQAAARLNIRSAISTPPLPLHTGAIRYYREQKA